MAVRNRNKEIRKVRVGDLRNNPANHRVHGDQQKAAMLGILDEVGFVGTLLAFELSDGTLRMLDGHLRRDSLDDDDEVEVCVVDLTPEERRKVLATFDAVAGMARIDSAKLDALIADIKIDSPAIQAMLAELSEKAAQASTESLSESDDSPQPDDGDWPDINQTEVHQFLVRCSDEELELVKSFVGKHDIPENRLGAYVLQRIKDFVAS